MYQRYFEENSGRVFPIYGYSPPPQNYWWIDDQKFYTEDFRTTERYKEYLDCGFNVLFLQRTAAYNGEPWEECDMKKAMEAAVSAGVEKIIVVDERIFDLSKVAGGLIGEGKRFASEQELDDFLRNCLQTYRHQKGFYGIQLMDEPFHPLLQSVGQVFRAMKRIDPSIFVHCNLNPLILPTLLYRMCPPGKTMVEAYENYLTMFAEETGADYIMADVYPFVRAGEGASIGKYYFAGLETLARTCKKLGKEMHIVMQSFRMRIGNRLHHKLPNREMMEFQKNVMIGFGVKEFSYFTYWTKQANYSKGEMYPDGSAMMTRDGQQTKLYSYVQKINRELTELAPMLWDFEYQANAFCITPPLFTRPMYLDMVRSEELSQVTHAETDKEVALINELYDAKREQYLYVVTNVSDPKRYRKFHKREKQRTQLVFQKGYNVADVYANGQWKTVRLQDGLLEIELDTGDGAMILPYTEEV